MTSDGWSGNLSVEAGAGRGARAGAARGATLAAAALTLALAAPRAGAQGLRTLLWDSVYAGFTPTAGSHQGHFDADLLSARQPLEQIGLLLANELTSFPVASSSGGFAYTFDPSLGVFVRAVDSFGPIYAERAETNGKGKLSLGLVYTHADFDRINGHDLGDGQSVGLVLRHELAPGTDYLNPWFQGDVITAGLGITLKSDTALVVGSYGITDRLDVGLSVPVVSVKMSGGIGLTIQRLATVNQPAIHRFATGDGTTSTVATEGSASGLGDVAVRGKYRLVKDGAAGLTVLADVLLPTGDEEDLLGTGTTRLKGLVVGSVHLGTFTPHVNVGYQASLSERTTFPDELLFTGGFDWAVHPRVTIAADLIGRTFVNAPYLAVTAQTFDASTNPAGATEPNTSGTFPVVTQEKRTYTSLLGAAGVKVNPFGTLLVHGNVLFSLNDQGLKSTSVIPTVGLDYSF